jgi:FkbM family methyltransferase
LVNDQKYAPDEACPASSTFVCPSLFGPMVLNRHDRFIGRAIQDHGCWAMREILLLNGILRRKLESGKTVTVYDVGANVGAYTLPLAKAFGDRIRIRAFEAQSRIFDMLRLTLSLNAISTVSCHHVAVSDTDGATLDIRLPDYDQDNNFGGLELMEPERSDNGEMRWSGLTETVRTVCLDGFDEAVDLIKIDVEGMEHRVLRGAVSTLSKHRPVCLVEILKTDRATVMTLFRELDYHGYRQSDELFAVPAEEDWTFPGLERII